MKFSAEDFEPTPKPPDAINTLKQQYDEMQSRALEPYDTPGEPILHQKVTPGGPTPGYYK